MHKLAVTVVLALATIAVAAPILDRVSHADAAAGDANTTSVSLSSAAADPVRLYTHPTAGWSAEIPSGWTVEEAGADVTLRSYDASRTPFETDRRVTRPFLPPAEIRIDVQRLTNYPHSNARAFVDEVLAAPDPTRAEQVVTSRRDDLVVAGQPATLVMVSTNTPPQPQQSVRNYFVLTESANFVLFVRAWPDRTTHSSELDHFLATLKAP